MEFVVFVVVGVVLVIVSASLGSIDKGGGDQPRLPHPNTDLRVVYIDQPPEAPRLARMREEPPPDLITDSRTRDQYLREMIAYAWTVGATHGIKQDRRFYRFDFPNGNHVLVHAYPSNGRAIYQDRARLSRAGEADKKGKA